MRIAPAIRCAKSWQTPAFCAKACASGVSIWVLALRYREDRGALRVLVNGQTGQVAGVVPWSRLRIALAVAAALLVVAAVVAAIAWMEPS